MVLLLDKIARRCQRAWHARVTMPAMRKRLKSCGKNVFIECGADVTCERVSVGDNSYLGRRTTILSTRADVIIGKDVMFGPDVTIITGNHRTDLIGRTMRSVTDAEKRAQDDEDVVIGDDVWVGCRATILKGVTIGDGSVVAAGSVVTKSVPPYSIVAGVPARVIKSRFSEDDLQKHIALLELSSFHK